MILDWNDAYANAPHIQDGAEYPARFAAAAEAFRADLPKRAAEYDLAYGPDPRHRFDLFYPEGPSHGLAVFVHGGFWQAFDKSAWSHLAAGARARGWTVALPSYRLAPQVTIPGITQDVAAAITAAAARINGPIYLAGHSAGGHLVSRMTSHTTPLTADVTSRLRHVLSISGLHVSAVVAAAYFLALKLLALWPWLALRVRPQRAPWPRSPRRWTNASSGRSA